MFESSSPYYRAIEDMTKPRLLVIRNALFFGRDNVSDRLIPWCTCTDPEVAHVGLYERDLEEWAIPYKTLTCPFEHVDRSILEGDTEGWLPQGFSPARAHPRALRLTR